MVEKTRTEADEGRHLPLDDPTDYLSCDRTLAEEFIADGTIHSLTVKGLLCMRKNDVDVCVEACLETAGR